MAVISDQEPVQSSMTELPHGLVLIEYVQVIQEAHGVGTSQGERVLIEARNDAEAIECWLRDRAPSKSTYIAYQKQASRFLLWCVLVARKPFCLLTREDYERYRQFMKDPLPRALWCGARGGRAAARGSRQWRPFVRPLADDECNRAFSIIKGLMDYLLDANYIQSHPLRLLRKRRTHSSTLEARQLRIRQRVLPPVEWKAFLDALQNWPENSAKARAEKERLLFIVAMLYLLGLRIHELVQSNWSAFQKIEGQWWFLVEGKGSKLGMVPVNHELLRAIVRYRAYRGKTLYPTEKETEMLCLSVTDYKPIGIRQVFNLVKAIALKAAEKFPPHSDSHQLLRQFSPHWLRHQSGTLQARAGIEKEFIKANHRHEKLDTTMQYVHTLERERHEAMQRLTYLPENFT